MSIIQKLLLPLIRRKIIKEGKKWAEETENYGIHEWKTYQANRFDRLKKNEWTSKVFPDLKKYKYDELPNYPITYEFPKYPEDFPAARTIYSTGTVKRKVIKFTKEDLLYAGITFAGGFQKALRADNPIVKRYILALVGGDSYISGNMATIASYFFVNSTKLDPLEIKSNLKTIKKKGEVGAVFGVQAFIMAFLELLDENIFLEDVWIGNGGDALTPTFMRYVREKLKSLGDISPVFLDFYACSEGMSLGFSADFLSGDPSLVSSATFNIQILEKEDGKMVNILDAKPGDRGILHITPMFTFMVPNYRLGDIVEVFGYSPLFKLPKIRVLGRDIFKVTLSHPQIGELSGFSGGMLRVFGIPFNTYAFDALMSKFTSIYFLIVEKEGNKALFRLFMDKPISFELLETQLKSNMDLFPIYLGLETGVIEFEITPVNTNFKEVIMRNWKGGQLKVPKIIIKSEVIEQPAKVAH